MAKPSNISTPLKKPSTTCGYVGLLGAPNVGKSTLLNRILGQHVAIVSNKPQTTRVRMLGIHTHGSNQLVFVDTPGLHRAQSPLNRYMVQEALSALNDIDCAVLVTSIERKRGRKQSPVRIGDLDGFVFDKIQQSPALKQLIVVINKIDQLSDRRHLLPLLEAWQARGVETVIPLSAQKADGVDRLLEQIAAAIPAAPHLFPKEMITDRAERWLASEYIREQVLAHSGQEVPHATAVEIETFNERPNKGDVMIDAAICVERAGQKAILIGKQGAMIGKIGTASRNRISDLLHCPVHLRLTVRLAADWRKHAARRRRFGYE